MRFKNIVVEGVLVGFFVPLITLLIFYFLRYQSEIGLISFFKQLIVLGVHMKVLALSIFCSNLILFYIFIKAEFLKIAKGILISTIIYTLLMVFLKFV